MSKKPTTKKNATAAAKADKLPGEDLDLDAIARGSKKSESVEDNGPMWFPESVLNGTYQQVEEPSSTATVGQEQAPLLPVVSQDSNVAEQPKPSKKKANSKNVASAEQSESTPMKVKGDNHQKNIQSENVDGAATPSEPVETQKNKVKNSNKPAKENKEKKKGKSVKSKADTKKKDKHKPFRRGHDLDMDSKVKSEFFSMRLSAKELDTLSKKAAKCHMSTSTYARETLLSSVPRESLTEKEKNAMDKGNLMLEDANFNVRQMTNYFHSMLKETTKEGKEKYELLTWKELKEVVRKQKALLDYFDKEFRINKK